MFCTVCATANSLADTTCVACGAVLSRTVPLKRGVGPDKEARRRARRTKSTPGTIGYVLALVPLFLVLTAGGTIGIRYRSERSSLAAAYHRGEDAIASGDVNTAVSAFALAGSYRDAASRRESIQNEVAPLQNAYYDGAAALDAGRYDEAIAALLPVARAMPTYEDVLTLLDEARHQRASELARDAEVAISRHDWLEADHALSALLADDPGNAELAQRLATLRRDHAPILFTRDSSLYVIGPDLSDERQLTDDITASAPAWSPDRSQIAFFSPDTDAVGTARLYVINADGSGLRQLAEDALLDWWPAWSPDGTKIAFSSVASFSVGDQRGFASTHIVDLKSGVETNLTGDHYTSATSASWSPDSQRVAFISRKVYNSIGIGNVRSSQEQVIVADLATGTFTSVTGDGLPGASRVSWSPADRYLLVLTKQGDPSAYGGQQLTAIHSVDLATDTIEQLTPRTQNVGPPFWSPDGTRFAYVEGNPERGNSVVRVRWIGGKREAGIGITQSISLMLTWSVDGQALIALASDPSQGSALIPLIDGPGSQVNLPIIFDMAPNLGPLQWSPVITDNQSTLPSYGGTSLDTVAT
jgi:Tol biopolymer transport system component